MSMTILIYLNSIQDYRSDAINVEMFLVFFWGNISALRLNSFSNTCLFGSFFRGSKTSRALLVHLCPWCLLMYQNGNLDRILYLRKMENSYHSINCHVEQSSWTDNGKHSVNVFKDFNHHCIFISGSRPAT